MVRGKKHKYRLPIFNSGLTANRFLSYKVIFPKDDEELQQLENEIQKQGITNSTIEKYEETQRKRWIRALLIHIILIVLLIVYSFIGAAIFQALEKEEEYVVSVDLKSAKSNLVELILSLDKSQSNYTEELNAILADYDSKLIEAHGLGVDTTDESQYEQNITTTSSGKSWDLWNSMLYAGTIYTTIGYGHLYPLTTGGKIATMIYAILGIPLCLIVLADMGGLLSELIKYIMRKCKMCFHRCRQGEWPTPEDVRHLSGISIFIFLVCIGVTYVFIGAALYTVWETEWSYMDSFYFLFVSFSTIGFGDITPNHPRFFLLTFVYIFLGLALISTGFTVLQQAFQSTLNRATDELNAKLGYSRDSSTSSSSDQDRAQVNLVRMHSSAPIDETEEISLANAEA